MRIERAIERFLEHGQLQHDWTPDTIRGYGGLLYKLADAYPGSLVSDFEGREGYDRLIDFLSRWATASRNTRGTYISTLHSFFDWLQEQWLIENNAAQRIKRPPKRKTIRDRPAPAESQLLVRAASVTGHERPAILAMVGAGFRRSSVLTSQWQHWNLTEGTVRAFVKGQNWVEMPLLPDVVEELRECVRVLRPDPDHYLYPAQRVRYDRHGYNQRETLDPLMPGSGGALYGMLQRVSKCALGRELHPHQLRHAFADRLDALGLDLRTAQMLMGHAQVQTTEEYMQKRRLEDAAERLYEATHKHRQSGQRGHRPQAGTRSPARFPSPADNPYYESPADAPLLDDIPERLDERDTAPNGGHK